MYSTKTKGSASVGAYSQPSPFTVIERTRSASTGFDIGNRAAPRCVRFSKLWGTNHEPYGGPTMNPILFLSLVIILTAALPWWPYSAYGRLLYHRPWDWLLDTPSSEDKRLFWLHYNQQREALRRGPTPRASQPTVVKLNESNSEADLIQDVRKQFEERWVA